jgi:quercetin dioxygenase-like cupin family protein
MPDATIKRISDFEAISPGFTKARAELGVTSVGMQVVDLPPGFERYPTHDHVADGQEEVYITLAGGGTLVVDEQPHEINSEVLARVGPATRRKLVAGPEGMRVLVLGGVPGTFEAKPFTELSADGPEPASG